MGPTAGAFSFPVILATPRNLRSDQFGREVHGSYLHIGGSKVVCGRSYDVEYLQTNTGYYLIRNLNAPALLQCSRLSGEIKEAVTAGAGTQVRREIFSLHVVTRSSPKIVSRSGRVNLIGEHTDYDGFVMPWRSVFGLCKHSAALANRRLASFPESFPEQTG
jgi:hypothetical protein